MQWLNALYDMKREGGIREETCVHFKKAEFVKNLLQVCLKSIKHEGQGAVNR